MPSLEQLIQRHINPFDPTTFKPGNFWHETQDPNQEVTSIHQAVLDQIEQSLEAVLRDHQTRTLLLAGDSGSGKSYLLGRLKRLLNDRAGFVYIGPWPDSQFIWRHTLRQTVDSLLQVPAGQRQSQLLRWLQGLPAVCDRSMAKWMLGERRLFIRDLRASFPVGIYNAKEFFGVLYDLTNPELRPLACDWLRGDDLAEEDLAALRVRQSIDSEDAAQKLLSNFGRIAASTQPLVLCFDNLDNIPLLPTGRPDLQSLFSLNSTLHNEKLDNFLILISIITSTWRQNQAAIQPADLARLHHRLALKSINLDQAMALWASRLHPLHLQVEVPPASAIAPLTRDWLAHKFPGGRTLPRNVLMLGQQLMQSVKETGQLPTIPAVAAVPATPPPPPPNLKASFGLVWQDQWQTVSQQVTRMGQFSSPELIRRLYEALQALQVEGVTTPFLQRTKFSAYSLTYDQPIKTGLVWTEDRNMTSFYHLMRACQKMLDQGGCSRLYLLRAEPLGKPASQGYKLFKQIFSCAYYLHVQPDLAAVQLLETYHRLVNAACGGELVVGAATPDLPMLQRLVRESQVLHDCPLLQELELVPETVARRRPEPRVSAQAVKQVPPRSGKAAAPATVQWQSAQQHILNLMEIQSLMGLQLLVEHTQKHLGVSSEQEVLHIIDQLCQDRRLQILDPQAKPHERLICWVPTDG